jgi:phosphoserine phosphatase
VSGPPATADDVTSPPTPAHPRYASVVLDVDSTLCGVEGVDWLAERRGPHVAAEVARLTERAMDGELALDTVYGERLAMIQPSAPEIAALALAYRRALAPGAPAAVARLVRHGVRVVLVSGGIREAILPIAAGLRLPPADVHAVSLRFDATGAYAGFDIASPLATQRGKLEVVRALALPRPALAVGDGATDAAMRSAVDAFAAFTGFVRRPAVLIAADMELPSFAHLLEAVLP